MASKTSESQREKLALLLMKRLEGKRGLTNKIADLLTSSFGTVTFLLGNFLFFAFWILTNVGMVPFFREFDPFPFGLLTMIVSLEAIFLSTIVLISQNREGALTRLRMELDLIVTVDAEEEITRILSMLDEIHDHLGLNPRDDAELTEMKGKIDINHLRELLMNRHQ
ncbi:MAG: DUF1003 domain-containing protein [Candidatus Liptonbacteria bacterium]|nr:DUF1003 domain-containing protein [Candidatus Liptonbacteria bacterium]